MECLKPDCSVTALPPLLSQYVGQNVVDIFDENNEAVGTMKGHTKHRPLKTLEGQANYAVILTCEQVGTYTVTVSATFTREAKDLVGPVFDTVDINCVEKLTKPGDTDGDGCADAHENGPDETLGGQRDWQNRWDYYDVAGSPLPPQNGAPDGVVDLPNDILGVIQHHPAGTLGYDAQFDRGTWTGPNSWNDTQGPDGVIDLPNDILGVILQFQHRCA